MPRRLKQGVGRGLFHDPAQIHHGHPVAHMPDDPEIVGNQDQGQPQIATQIGQQVHHLRLHRHVQRRDRLVPDDQSRPRGQRAGNPDALSLPAREFMRIAVGIFRAQPHLTQQLGNLFPPFRSAHLGRMHLQRLANQPPDAQPGVQR